MTTMTSESIAPHTLSATNIPALTHREAGILARSEYERLLAQIEALDEGDWSEQTDCSEWTVHAMVAHLAGAVAGYAGWNEFKRQYISNPFMKDAKMKIDGINRRQVEDRAGKTPSELIAEFREKAPKAIRTRQGLPWLLRALKVPFGPPLGFASVGYLTDTIYTRDQWMHRLDLARAAGLPLEMSREHDGRIVDLIMRDIERKLSSELRGRTIDLILDGPLQLSYRFGRGANADATIEMDIREFNRLASGRLSPEAARKHARIHGAVDAGVWFLNNCEVPY